MWVNLDVRKINSIFNAYLRRISCVFSAKIVSLQKIKFDMAKYIYQHENWTNFTWNEQKIKGLYGEVKYLQGKLSGIMSTIGFSQK